GAEIDGGKTDRRKVYEKSEFGAGCKHRGDEQRGGEELSPHREPEEPAAVLAAKMVGEIAAGERADGAGDAGDRAVDDADLGGAHGDAIVDAIDDLRAAEAESLLQVREGPGAVGAFEEGRNEIADAIGDEEAGAGGERVVAERLEGPELPEGLHEGQACDGRRAGESALRLAHRDP